MEERRLIPRSLSVVGAAHDITQKGYSWMKNEGERRCSPFFLSYESLSLYAASIGTCMYMYTFLIEALLTPTSILATDWTIETVADSYKKVLLRCKNTRALIAD